MSRVTVSEWKSLMSVPAAVATHRLALCETHDHQLLGHRAMHQHAAGHLAHAFVVGLTGFLHKAT